MNRLFGLSVMVMAIAICGCGDNKKKDGPIASSSTSSTTAPDSTSPDKMHVFSLATSEYPSWSTFIVAGKAGLINPAQGGKPGSLELKWGVDVVLHVKDYDPCLTMYGGGTVDAVCMTNIDALNPALGRPSTAIMPTSTSDGADQVIAVGNIGTGDQLKGVPVYGLAKSVSEYVFVRGLQKQNLLPEDFQFHNLEPGPAATALQTGSNDVKAICVWNPFALQTTRLVRGSHIVFSSKSIPEEVIDMVVVANDSLKKPGGDKFACCLCDAFYSICQKMDDPATKNATLQAIGQDFCNLPVEDMAICCEETRFYNTPDAGTALFKGANFASTMGTVVSTCQKIHILETTVPTLGYGDDTAQLNFDTKYMERYKTGK